MFTRLGNAIEAACKFLLFSVAVIVLFMCYFQPVATSMRADVPDSMRALFEVTAKILPGTVENTIRKEMDAELEGRRVVYLQRIGDTWIGLTRPVEQNKTK